MYRANLAELRHVVWTLELKFCKNTVFLNVFICKGHVCGEYFVDDPPIFDTNFINTFKTIFFSNNFFYNRG